MRQHTTKPTIRLVRPAKTQSSLRMRAVWSESSLIALAFNNYQTIQRVINENPCHTGRMYMLICLCWSHRSYYRFCRALAQIIDYTTGQDTLNRSYAMFYKEGSSVQKHAYWNILKILQSKTENFQIKKIRNFLYFCSKQRFGYSLEPPRRGGSNECPQSIFWSRNKKNNVQCIPCKPQFYCLKVGFKGVKLYSHVFVMFRSSASILKGSTFNWASARQNLQ